MSALALEAQHELGYALRIVHLSYAAVADIVILAEHALQIAAAEEAKRIEEQQAEEARQKAEAEKQRAEQERLAYMQTTEYKQNLWVNHRKNIRDMAMQFKLPQVILAQCGYALSQECANPVAAPMPTCRGSPGHRPEKRWCQGFERGKDSSREQCQKCKTEVCINALTPRGAA